MLFHTESWVEAYPVWEGREARYILDRSPVHHRVDICTAWTVGGNLSVQREPTQTEEETE